MSLESKVEIVGWNMRAIVSMYYTGVHNIDRHYHKMVYQTGFQMLQKVEQRMALRMDNQDVGLKCLQTEHRLL